MIQDLAVAYSIRIQNSTDELSLGKCYVALLSKRHRQKESTAAIPQDYYEQRIIIILQRGVERESGRKG